MKSVLVLCGGPDREREVSLQSGRCVADALRDSGRFDVHHQVIDRIDGAGLARMKGDVIWPVLHGGWGEGGPLQDILESSGRPYVGCRPRAARLAMDKVATKEAATRVGIRTTQTAIFNPHDEQCALAFPVVVKPIFEGSTIGLHICKSPDDWRRARESAKQDPRPTMIESFIAGRELTVGIIDRGNGLEALPLIEIKPAEGLYDYEAKYTRDDTQYIVNPNIPATATREMQEAALNLARDLGVRHLARADFILDDQGRSWLLEINTMPGFTTHSLVPKAAAAIGLPMAELCAVLVERAAAGGR